MNLILYSVKRFYEMVKIFSVVISAQICYHEAQIIRGSYRLHCFMGHLPEPWERPLIRKVATRFRKSPTGVIHFLLNDIFHENHKDWISPGFFKGSWVRLPIKRIGANSKLSVHAYIGTGPASRVRLYARTDDFISLLYRALLLWLWANLKKPG